MKQIAGVPIWVIALCAVFLLGFGFIKPTNVAASEMNQTELRATYLWLESIACTTNASHVRIRFEVRNVPSSWQIVSYGQVSYLLNGANRTTSVGTAHGTTVGYNDFVATNLQSYNVSEGRVTIVTTSGSYTYELQNPGGVTIEECVPKVTATWTATPTETGTSTPTATATATHTSTPTTTATATETPSPTSSPTGTVSPTATWTATSTETPTATSTTDETPTWTPTGTTMTPTDVTATATSTQGETPAIQPTFEVTNTATPGPDFAQCAWYVPAHLIGEEFEVWSEDGGQQFGTDKQYVSEKDGGVQVRVMFGLDQAGLKGKIVIVRTGETLFYFQFWGDGQGTDELHNCIIETQTRSEATPTPVPTGCENCGPAKREVIPTGGIVIVNYAICADRKDTCNPELLLKLTVYQGEVPFEVIVSGVRFAAQAVTNVRGMFYILDEVPTLQSRTLINPDGTDFTGPLAEFTSCSVWPTFARLNGTQMRYWNGGTKSDVAVWLREETEVVYETTYPFAERLSAKPWQTLEVPTEILEGLEN